MRPAGRSAWLSRHAAADGRPCPAPPSACAATRRCCCRALRLMAASWTRVFCPTGPRKQGAARMVLAVDCMVSAMVQLSDVREACPMNGAKRETGRRRADVQAFPQPCMRRVEACSLYSGQADGDVLAGAAPSPRAATLVGQHSPAFAAAMTPVRSLFITLKRSFAGTREHHVRILQSLGLSYRQQTVEKPNAAHIRGAIDKVGEHAAWPVGLWRRLASADRRRDPRSGCFSH